MTPSRKPENHRTRVGAERRQRMRAHLLESALAVFAEHGVDASIDDVIAAAEVSRGTFYNYFQTNQEVLRALADELAKELIGLVETTVAVFEDPMRRVGVGTRLFLTVAREHPQFASFLWRTAFHAATAALVLGEFLPRHIEEGIKAGKFSVTNAVTGLTVVAGITLAGTFGFSNFAVTDDYVEELTRSVLLGLGANRKDTERVLSLALPELTFPDGSLFARTQKKPKKGKRS